ncbi:MAG: ABC transporter permease [Desulfobacterales bacterium]|nr:MAG: ABC transporter permease [Desulfobacterales bacterium]
MMATAHARKGLILYTFKRTKTSVVGVVLAALMVGLALLAPWIAPYDPIEQNVKLQYAPPSLTHLCGTDGYGRDEFSRILWGSRVSLMVGLASVLLSMVGGIPLGVVAGYRGGKADAVISRFNDVFMSFPIVIFGLLILAIMGPGLIKIIIAIGVALTPRIARLARGSTLSLKEMPYIEAARAVGQSDPKIIILHVLPNILGEILVMGTLWIATAIIVEASLSFIGLGVRPPTPSWGSMIRAGLDQLTNAPWLSLFPGLAIFLTVFAFNLIADGLRDIADPKLRG